MSDKAALFAAPETAEVPRVGARHCSSKSRGIRHSNEMIPGRRVSVIAHAFIAANGSSSEIPKSKITK